MQQAEQREDLVVELVDIADQGLPLLDEPIPASSGRYSQPHTGAWSEVISGFDGFVFVTPEYNGAIPASLKNALDYLYAEWAEKPAAIVGYGGSGGVRAAESLRGLLSHIGVYPLKNQVALTLRDDTKDGSAAPREHQERSLGRLLEAMARWAGPMRDVRVGETS